MSSTVSTQEQKAAKTVYEHVRDIWSDVNTKEDQEGLSQRATRVRLSQLSQGIDRASPADYRQKVLKELRQSIQKSDPDSTVASAIATIGPKV